MWPDSYFRALVAPKGNAPVTVDLRSDQSEQESLNWLAQRALRLGGDLAQEATNRQVARETTVALPISEVQRIAELLEEVSLTAPRPDFRHIHRRAQAMASLLWDHLRR